MGDSSENANDFRKRYIQVTNISQTFSKYPRWRTSWVTPKPTNHYADADLCFYANATNWLYPKLQSRQFNGTNYFHHSQIMAPEGRSILEAYMCLLNSKKDQKVRNKTTSKLQIFGLKAYSLKNHCKPLFIKAHIAFSRARKK